MDMAERSRALEDYLVALQRELSKIQVFQRELPLSLHLVNQAIESVRQQIEAEKNNKNSNNSSGSGAAVDVMEEERNSSRPVLEEFLPLKPSLSNEDQEQERKHHDNDETDHQADEIEKEVKKPDWLRYVQLWNQEPEPNPTTTATEINHNNNNNSVVKPVAVQLKKNFGTGAFQPFEREKRPVKESSPSSPLPMQTDSAVATGNGKMCNSNKKSSTDLDNKEIKDTSQESSQTLQRKTRRCWSPELHRRFLNALQQLGGSHVATPKQIRELMKVDGLTNDEVKSHLQKYRLHTRRPSPAVQSSGASPQTPQFVVVGGIWVPPPEYAAAAAAAAVNTLPEATAAAAMNGIYTPVAALPPESTSLKTSKKQTHKSPRGPLNSPGRVSKEDDDDNGEATNSSSPATSSTSTQTTTASPCSKP